MKIIEIMNVSTEWIEVAEQVGRELNLDFDEINIKELAKGIEIEHEHDDIIDGDHVLSAKIALAHLKEFPDYYTRLVRMENEARNGKYTFGEF